MSTLGPTAAVLDLAPVPVRGWQGGAAYNCWTLRYNRVLPAWELAAGNGLVLYRMSSEFTPDASNVFDDLIYDLTLQAPPSITIYPLSQLPCNCPGLLEPLDRPLILTPHMPRITSSGLPPVVTTCCPGGMPAVFHCDVDSSVYPEVNGTYTLVYTPGSVVFGFDGWLSPPQSSCGATWYLFVRCLGPNWEFYWYRAGGFTVVNLGVGCPPASDGVPFAIVSFSIGHCLSLNGTLMTVHFS